MLTEAVEACKASIEAGKGRMVVKEAARAVSEKEERALEEELQVGRLGCPVACFPCLVLSLLCDEGGELVEPDRARCTPAQAAEAANREVSGDTDEDEEFEEGMDVDVDAPALAV